MTTERFGPTVLVAALLISAARPTTAHAELNESIDLTVSEGLQLQRMTDLRWAGLQVGLPGPTVPSQNLFGRCGCLLTTLSTATTSVVGGSGSLPWFAHLEVLPETGYLGTKWSLSPPYLQDYFMLNPLDANAPLGWGYVPGTSVTCGVSIKPSAADFMASPLYIEGEPFTPTGLTWDVRKWDASARDEVDAGLRRGLPSIVVIRIPGGFHANLIVGWDNVAKQYLIHDPLWITQELGGGNGVHPMGHGFAPAGATAEEDYRNYQAAIDHVRPLRPFYRVRSRWLTIFDDPEPIELRLTDPRGRRTGHDPEGGQKLQENPAAYYDELTSWADPLGVFAEAAPLRSIAAHDPEPGVYGLEVFGTGDGPFTLTIGTIDDGLEEVVSTLTGDITNGETRRYEIVYAPDGTSTVAAVAAFGPHARAGNDAAGQVGAAVVFDGRGSSQIAGTLSSYAWSFGDGESGSGARLTHVYAATGSYLASLTVTSADGLTDRDERAIVVAEAGTAPVKETLRVSVSSDDTEANDTSWENPKVSADGRFVAFESFAYNLVDQDTNGLPDIFVKDLSDGSIERVSVATSGEQADDYSRSPAISANGRFISFFSAATNLGAAGPSFFVHDRDTGITEVVVRTSDRAEAAGLSADGRYVAFLSVDDGHVHVRDRVLGTEEDLSAYGGEWPSLSSDGRFVAYSAGFGPDDLDFNGGKSDVYVRDRQTGTTELISLSASGAQIANSWHPSISADGRLVAFEVHLAGGAVGDPAARNDVLVRDRLLGITEKINDVSVEMGSSRVPTLSPSGRYVSFISAPNMALAVPQQVYLRDRQAGTTEMVTVETDGSPSTNGVGFNERGSVTADGAVVFASFSPDLIAMDTNLVHDIFMRRKVPGGGGGSATPLANLGGPYLGWASSVAVPAGVRLDGSGSFAPNGEPLSAHWDFGDGSPPTDAGLVTTHAYTVPGIYQVTLTVESGGDVSAPVHTEVEVLPPLPADGLSMGACVAPGETLSLDGAARMANATLIANGWDNSTGPIQPSPVTITFPWGQVLWPTSLPGLTFQGQVTAPRDTVPGQYDAAVTGGPGAAFNVPCGVSANLRPLAVAGGPIYHAQAGVPLALDGSYSSDPEGAALTYSWDLGDTTSASTVTPTHAYPFAGSFLVTLTVNDGVADSATMIGTHSFAMVVVDADGAMHAGCDGVPDSGTTFDPCGVCGGDGSSCSGCLSDGDCADGNACTLDRCDAQTRTCSSTSIPSCCQSDGPCADGNVCTTDACDLDTNTCSSSVITGCCTTDAACGDGSSCTTDTCDRLTRRCTHTARPGCCTASPDCDDANACTLDSCSESGACVHATIAGCCRSAGDCTDDDSCTRDACDLGTRTCTHMQVAGCCSLDQQCGDADVCTHDTCDQGTHSCVHPAIGGCCSSDPDCVDGAVCTTDHCDPATHTCQNTPVSGCCTSPSDCDDVDACTLETCDVATGACVHAAIAGCCTSDAQCGDDQPCTIDTCSGRMTCVHQPDPTCLPDAAPTPMRPDAAPADASVHDVLDGSIDAADEVTDPSSRAGGCGCRVAGHPGSAPAGRAGALAALSLLALLGMRSQRQRRRARSTAVSK